MTIKKEGIILLYQNNDTKVTVNVRFENETFWLTQAKIAELFGVDRSVITKHLKNIYSEGELSHEATCAKIAQVRKEGGREIERDIDFFNLYAIS